MAYKVKAQKFDAINKQTMRVKQAWNKTRTGASRSPLRVAAHGRSRRKAS